MTTAVTAGGAAAATPTATGNGGLQIDIGVRTGLSLDDNFQLRPGGGTGSSTINDTNLSFGVSSIGQYQTLSFVGTGVVRFAHIPGRSIAGFEDPNLRFRYSRDAKNSRLAIDARYRHADREFLNPFQVEREDQISNGLVGNGGTLTSRTAKITYDIGINDPIGFTFSASHDDRKYANVTNPSLYDNRTDVVSVTGNFNVSQVTRLSASAGRTVYDAEDFAQTHRNTTDYSIGLVQDINQALVLNARIGYSQIETDQFGILRTRSGLTGQIGLVQSFNNGSASANLTTSQNTNGSRTTLSFGRVLQLPNGNLSGTVGVTRGPSGTTKAIGSLSYDKTLKSGNFSVSLSRSATTNTASNELLDTRVSVSYGHEIDNNSRIDVTLDFGRSERNGIGTNPTVNRTNLRAAYTRALTSDWNVQGGVLLRHVNDSSASGPAQSNSVFVSIDRNFSFRP